MGGDSALGLEIEKMKWKKDVRDEVTDGKINMWKRQKKVEREREGDWVKD